MPMSRRLVLAAPAFLLGRALLAAERTEFVGSWSSVLESGSLRLRLKFDMSADGAVVLHSLDQDGPPVPGRARWKADQLELEFSSIKARYSGRIAGTHRIEGKWRQGATTPMILQRGAAAFEEPATVVPAMDADQLQRLRAVSRAPALAAASAMRSGPPDVWVAGERSLGSGAAATPQDQWHWGSISKSFTATLVARLVEAGTIRWDDTVGGLLGAVAPQMHSQYRDASFRHLLSHRAGLPGDLPLTQLLKFLLRGSSNIMEQRRDYARIALGLKPLASREERYSYSNNGYVIAGAMLEAKTGRPWETLLREQVFEPLGLHSAGFGPPGSVGKLEQPVGHASDVDTRLVNLFGTHLVKPQPPGHAASDNPAVIGPAGTVHSSIKDLLIFASAHRDATPLLSRASWGVLHTPPFGGDYAMGWMRRADGSLWHNGSNNRWYAEVTFNVATGIAACAVANDARPEARHAVGKALLGAMRAATRASAAGESVGGLAQGFRDSGFEG
jgi:CubicO group peptidase (beta-lactamase class C family)